MDKKALSEQMEAYIVHLEEEERSDATRKQYRRDISCFLTWAESMELAKETVIRYKEKLREKYRASSVNAKLAAINSFFNYMDRPDLKVRQLRIQRQAYCSEERELKKEEYLKLVEEAEKQDNEKLSLIIQTICATGIRVSELRFITAEAIRYGEAFINLKGKNRTVLIPGRLRRVLGIYLKQKKIESGPIFITRTGRPIDRSNIWKMMKKLCISAGIEPKKVFPHNLRHLFARCFYSVDKDLAKLADILGHSDINTTRIYIISTGIEHTKRMDALGLVV